ncbi:hypothetical protein [Mycolicibacterium sarraceniae]|nr:hypothetical protein [Mycolicibacterium sarraceniae]
MSVAACVTTCGAGGVRTAANGAVVAAVRLTPAASEIGVIAPPSMHG